MLSKLLTKNFITIGIVINTAMLIYYVSHLYLTHYLPYPFIYDSFDSFMDLYNPLWWLMNGGYYSEWKSVYPPLNFYILKIFSIFAPVSDYADAYEMRDLYPIYFLYIFLFILISYFLSQNNLWRHKDNKDKIKIFIFISLLAPMLFMLERANLILLTLPLISALLLARNNIIRAFLIAILINLKPYFLIFLLYFIAKRKFKYIFISLFLTSVIFIFFGFFLTDNPYYIFQNIIYFSKHIQELSPRELISMPTSIATYKDIFNSRHALEDGLDIFGVYYFILSSIVTLGYILRYFLFILALYLIFFKGLFERDEFIFLLLAIMITHIGPSIGGYSLVIYIPFLPILLRLGHINKVYNIFIFFVLYNYDVVYFLFNAGSTQTSYFFGDDLLLPDYKVGISAVLRPMFNSLIFVYFLIHFYTRAKLKFK